MMRRAAVLGAALGACAVVVVAGPSRADDGNWSGSWQQPSYTITDAASHDIAGALTHGSNTAPDKRSILITVDVAGDAPKGCSLPSGWTDDVDDSDTPTSVTNYFHAGIQPECNGTYQFVAWGHVDAVQPFASSDSSGPTVTTVEVRRPAPTVANVAATKVPMNRAVVVTWDGIGSAKDLTGIVVTRTDSAGNTVEMPHLPPSATSYWDSTIPPEGGSFTYAVTSTRYGVAPSAATQATVVKFDPASDPTSTTTSTSAPGGDGGAGTGTGTGTGPGTGGGTGTTGATTARSSNRVNPGAPVQAVDPDEGFETNLPYEAEPGAVAAELPSGDERNPAGAGVLVPFAVSLLLGVWAVLILYVTKSAREADEALTLLHLELE